MYKKSDIESERELYYILIGTLLIMLIWELKSRYIIMCIPPMAIMAQLGFEHVLKLKEQISTQLFILDIQHPKLTQMVAGFV